MATREDAALTTHVKPELVVLGVFDDARRVRHRAANGATPDEAASRATLAEMIDLERRIDGRVQAQRVAEAAGRARRHHWWWP